MRRAPSTAPAAAAMMMTKLLADDCVLRLNRAPLGKYKALEYQANVIEIVNYVKDMLQLHLATGIPKAMRNILRFTPRAFNDIHCAYSCRLSAKLWHLRE